MRLPIHERRVSSHTPLRVYSTAAQYGMNIRVFQVIPPCGGIPVSSRQFRSFCKFQVIPPCGGIPLPRQQRVTAGRFQVIPPCGGIPHTVIIGNAINSFQVIPPCGGIRSRTRPRPRGLCFKSYPLAGVFVKKDFLSLVSNSFKSYPLAGVFLYFLQPCVNNQCFKSYPLAGVFPNPYTVLSSRLLFQVIPPCGGIPVDKYG